MLLFVPSNTSRTSFYDKYKKLNLLQKKKAIGIIYTCGRDLAEKI